MATTLLLLCLCYAAASATAATVWRNETSNVAFAAAVNAYLRAVPFTAAHGGTGASDAQPVRLDWSVPGDVPEAVKDSVACWSTPDAAYPEGEVVIAGGLWPVGVAHLPSGHNRLNFSFAYDVARATWRSLPLPPFSAGRTQGACVGDDLIVISGGDGGTVANRVMRLSKKHGGDWAWDLDLPALPQNASRITGAAHAIDDRWLVIGLGNHNGPGTSVAAALTSYKLDLQRQDAGWMRIAPFPGPAASLFGGQEISVPIGAASGGKWYIFGGQTVHPAGSAAAEAWSEIPADLATLAVFGPRPTGSTVDLRDAFAYDPYADTWEELPSLPFNFVQGPKRAPVVGDGGRYILLLGAQRRLTVRRGAEPPGYMAAVNRPPIDGTVQYYGDDAVYFDTVRKVYGSLGKVPYGVVTCSYVCNGTHAMGFGGEPTHGWHGNTETAIQMARITIED